MSYTDDPGGREQSFVAPYLVLVMDCSSPLASSLRLSIAEVEQVDICRGNRRGHNRYSEAGHGVLQLDLDDSWMSAKHAHLHKTSGRWCLTDDGSKNGTLVNGVRASATTLSDGDLIEVGNSLILFRSEVDRRLREPADLEVSQDSHQPPAFATLNIALARKFAALERISTSSVPVVVCGETGTGKEVIARAVHELSRRDGDFVAINCGAIPESLIESELFGYRKGAFSGANEDRHGMIRAAHGGTLFLDEIAELPEPAQVKLLRVLQEGEVVPLGATSPVGVDIRVIAATHQDLPALVDSADFRQDLFARLSGFHIDLPPLRERREDIGILISALLPRIVGRDRAATSRLQRSAARALFTHAWPLNIRELELALSAATALADGMQVTLDHLPPTLQSEPTSPVIALQSADDALRKHLIELLEEHRGNVSAVAREMAKARVQIRRWCKRFSIDPETFRRH
jgi:transcriptional regulator with PAS, ATPase and Fis domain